MAGTKRGGRGRKYEKEKGREHLLIRESVFAFCPPISRLIG